MLTPWGEEVDPAAPWPEHPRPRLVRDGWVSLNGWWDHTVRPTSAPAPVDRADHDAGIVVPYSPEAALSRSGRVGRPLGTGETLYYRRTVVVPQELRTDDRRLLLHLGAVDQTCVVAVDGREVGRHDGGFWPFTIDVTDALVRGYGELTVAVTDPTESGTGARGKQRRDAGWIWYPAQSGIWQSVWLEAVPRTYVTDVEVLPIPDLADPARTVVEVTVHSNAPARARVRIGDTEVDGPTSLPLRVPLPHARLWSPEDPHLYDVDVSLAPPTGLADRVTSYVGVRTIGVGADPDDPAGPVRFLLNGRVQPMVGVLDQGYWPDGLLTPPSDAALEADVRAVRELGFTVLRKHVKVEPQRFYHHCDRLGVLVWQDLPNGGGRYRHSVTVLPAKRPVRLPDRGRAAYALLGRSEAAGRAAFERDLRRTVDLLAGHPSVVTWTVFNEGWGQFDARRLTALLQRLDPTRPVCPVSGWHDQGGRERRALGQVRSLHVYLRPVRLSRRLRRRERARGRAVVLGEYGGFHLAVPGHVPASGEEPFGYRSVADEAELADALATLEREEIGPARAAGVAATFYTQLTDVAAEVNGLLTWDRRVRKVARYPGPPTDPA